MVTHWVWKIQYRRTGCWRPVTWSWSNNNLKWTTDPTKVTCKNCMAAIKRAENELGAKIETPEDIYTDETKLHQH